jgi:hypothetical protein
MCSRRAETQQGRGQWGTRTNSGSPQKRGSQLRGHGHQRWPKCFSHLLCDSSAGDQGAVVGWNKWVRAVPVGPGCGGRRPSCDGRQMDAYMAKLLVSLFCHVLSGAHAAGAMEALHVRAGAQIQPVCNGAQDGRGPGCSQARIRNVGAPSGAKGPDIQAHQSAPAPRGACRPRPRADSPCAR